MKLLNRNLRVIEKVKKSGNLRKVGSVIALLIISSIPTWSFAHHVLGRPAYSLNEDSNTPPSMQVETQVGDFFITYMVYPAFPKPNERGRVNFYAESIKGGSSFKGVVEFTIETKSWFKKEVEVLGEQLPDDGVHRQGFIFSEAGKYIITASFNDGDVPYVIDFPLQIGKAAPIGFLGTVLILVFGFLVFVKLVLKKRLLTSKIQNSQEEQIREPLRKSSKTEAK